MAYVIQVGTMRKGLLFLATFPLMYLGYFVRDVLRIGAWSGDPGSGWMRGILHFDETIQFSFLMAGLIGLAWMFNRQWSKKRG